MSTVVRVAVATSLHLLMFFNFAEAKISDRSYERYPLVKRSLAGNFELKKPDYLAISRSVAKAVTATSATYC
jgi:hypothetical protein